MLSIGEFSNLCKVSTKTLRYYAEIGLLMPLKINPETGYRYYEIEQLEAMLFINRLKSYHFSLEEIKEILDGEVPQEELLIHALLEKQQMMMKHMQDIATIMDQLTLDIEHLKEGKSMMSYMETIDIQLEELLPMNVLSYRKHVQKQDYEKEYAGFYQLIREAMEQHLTMLMPPMVLFHESEFQELGLDSEFAIAVKECTAKTRIFEPGLCLKTVVHGSYIQLPSVYAKQIKWANEHGYENNGPLFEVYVKDPSQTLKESEYITEVYYPVKKI